MMTSSEIIDRVATQLDGLRKELPREAGYLRNLALRLDRVSNTLEASSEVSERVSQVEGDLERLGVDFTVEPSAAYRGATCIYAYKGQLDPRRESEVLGRIAKKYGSTLENPGNNQPYKIMIPHTV